MLQRVLRPLLLFTFILSLSFMASAAKLSPTLTQKLSGAADSLRLGTVIVAFQTSNGLNVAHLNILRGVGISTGSTFQNLGMVAVTATAGQVRRLASNPGVRSIWSNDRLHYYMDQARTVAGVNRVAGDSTFTTRNGGMPVSGKGDFSVMVIDSGIDATHADLRFGEKVVQNVQILTATGTLPGFTPLLVVENVPNTDQSVGHGTHCAGIVGGTGERSGGRYAGVAPGAKIVGAGLGAGLFVINGLAGWEWALANQYRYNIRVITNSYGGGGTFDADDPIMIASRLMYERNATILFAAGNSGPGKGTNSSYAKAPWVIGVAAGTKEGGLAAFSSRGTPRDERLTNSDPLDDFDAPTITAPGTGREFETNAAKFTSDIVSVRAISNLTANGTTADAELDPAVIPFYTQISGTSMATPFAAGVVALMLDADPTLTPDEIKQILTGTASRMPGYEDYEVGAGYINAHAAVDKVFNRTRNYGSFKEPAFNVQFTVSSPPAETFHVDYDPTATPGPASTNSYTFSVQPGMSVLDVFATFDNALETGDGNTIGMLLTDPAGTKYSSGIALPILDGNTRQVLVKNPIAGQWLLEIRGVRGLAALPNFSLPTSGAALPGPVDGTIIQKKFTLQNIPDIQGHVAQADIETVLKNRRMDILSDGLFHPNDNVTREGFLRTLNINVPLRQLLAAAPRFADVSGELGALAEAATANGSTLRDYNFTPQGVMSAAGTSFNPNATVNRLDVAVAFVRALGRDAEARALANTDVTYQGTTLSDNGGIPAALRGYVQMALDKGLFEAFPAEIQEVSPGQFVAVPGPRFEPNTLVTRAKLAQKLVIFGQAFVTGQ
jgi:serine protease AprX